MAALSGKTGTATTAGQLHLRVTRWSFNPTCDAVDVTGMSSGGYRDFVAGLLGAAISFDCKWETAPGGGQTGAPPDIETGASMTWQFETDSVPARTLSGDAIITAAPVDVVVEGDVSYSCEGTVTGSWTTV